MFHALLTPFRRGIPALSSPSARPNPAPSKPDAVKGDEERLAQALVGRGLVTEDEAKACRSPAGEAPARPEEFLKRLVKAGALAPNQARRVAQEVTALLQQDLPGYQILEKLGHGSMGTVYKARQLSMNRLVAVKMLHPRLAAKQDVWQRLVREAHMAAKLSHNNIVQAFDVGTAGNQYYFVMENVEGITIKQELEGGKIYTEAEALDIVLQIAQALQHAHRRGLIHRDVKPANIILTPERVAKLADLGMARETADEEMARAEKGMTIGTPFYIAPEQIRGQEDIDARADIYSLGATLYHMVTGQPPFPGTEIDQVLEAHLKQELTPPDHLNVSLSSGLGEVVEFMMAKDRNQRYRSADDLLFDLECLKNGQPPKLARERIEVETLAGLGEGVSDEEDDRPRPSRRESVYQNWAIVLGVLLGVSVLVNVFLLIRK